MLLLVEQSAIFIILIVGIVLLFELSRVRWFLKWCFQKSRPLARISKPRVMKSKNENDCPYAELLLSTNPTENTMHLVVWIGTDSPQSLVRRRRLNENASNRACFHYSPQIVLNQKECVFPNSGPNRRLNPRSVTFWKIKDMRGNTTKKPTY
jgi:hypothetical protein